MAGAYVPPHLRNRAAASTATASSSSSSTSSSAFSATRRPQSSERAAGPSNSRTPWSRATPASSSRNSFQAEPWPIYDQPGAAAGGNGNNSGRSLSGPGQPRAAMPTSSSPSLYVFGDSFVGPMKLLSNDCARKQTYKGASAKGLNNPTSAKQVAKQLLPALEDLMSPPPYRYTPSCGRWTLLIFGNVDLQINYLWQLQHKPISHLSFTKSTTTSPSSSTHGDTDTEEDDSPAVQRTVLARATETSLTGPALGPELFVQAVAKAYTSFLEREIVNGPIGERLRESAARRRAIQAGEATGKLPPPGKVLIAAALPPLVEDEILPRIPEKYVERLEDDHEKAQKALDATGRDWQAFKLSREASTEAVEAGMSTISMTDRPVTPVSGDSRSSQETYITNASTAPTSLSSPSSSASSPSSPRKSKTSIESLLLHDPPLCTLPVRISMTNAYNSLISSFCAQHPDVLSFLDISPQMHKLDGTAGYAGEEGSVDRATWACPVDPTNVHPLWEPTLPLWLEAMKAEGLPTEGYQVEEGEEDTFKAYEEDKRRRTKARKPEWERWERDRLEGKAREE